MRKPIESPANARKGLGEEDIVNEVKVYLYDGPEQGRELTAPTDGAGLPIPRLTISARPAHQPPRAGNPPVLIYERDHQRADGGWEYRYVGAEGRFDD